MPPITATLKRIAAAAAALAALAVPGCGPSAEDPIPVDHRMGFLADSLRRPPATSPTGYLIHPPAWARIHRDSLCFVVENPAGVAKLYALEIRLRDPRTGDSVGYGWTTLSTFLRSRAVACQPVDFVGGRKAWQAPVAVEMSLEENPGLATLASRKLVVDPDFAQLDLRPFPVRFFPDRIGMEWLFAISDNQGNASRSIRRLLSWEVLPRHPDGFCFQDTAIRLRYYSRDCAPGDPPSPDGDLLRCSAALDSALAAGPLVVQEWIDCAWSRRVQLDSAILANEADGYGAAFLFGKSRATHHDRSPGMDGLSWEIRSAEGVGDYEFVSLDSTTGVRIESRILAIQ